ncbi:MAG: hypothetical protein PIR02_01230 [Microbacterium enclense]
MTREDARRRRGCRDRTDRWRGGGAVPLPALAELRRRGHLGGLPEAPADAAVMGVAAVVFVVGIVVLAGGLLTRRSPA